MATGKRRNFSYEDEEEFWSFATIEVLRLTGICCEELLALSHHSITEYRLRLPRGAGRHLTVGDLCRAGGSLSRPCWRQWCRQVDSGEAAGRAVPTGYGRCPHRRHTPDIDSWRSRLACIFQEFTRYHATLADNVALGVADPGSVTREERAEALRRAGAAELLLLPQGLGTLLGEGYGGLYRTVGGPVAAHGTRPGAAGGRAGR